MTVDKWRPIKHLRELMGRFVRGVRCHLTE